jgi:hypothetical protein
MPKEYQSNTGFPYKVIVRIMIIIFCCFLGNTAIVNNENLTDITFFAIMIIGILITGTVFSGIFPNTKSVVLLENGILVKSFLKRQVISYSQIENISDFTNFVTKDFKLYEIFKVDFKSETQFGKRIYFSESNSKNKNKTSFVKELRARVLKNSC